jgi:hypothetical protein
VDASVTGVLVDKVEIIVQRRLGVIKPVQAKGREYGEQLIVDLLQYPPDDFVTPTIAIYRMSH